MVTDQEIAKGVETVLRQADPSAVTSLNGVVQQLEAKLGLDLSHKAAFIRDQIDLLLRSHPITTTASATAPASVTTTGHPPPQHQAFQFQQGQALNLTPKDHFALQFQQQFHPSHFAIHPHHQHQHQHHPQQHHQHQVFSQDLNFRQPQAVVTPPAPPPQLQAQQQHRQTQHVQNAGVVTNEVAKESSAPVGSKRRGGPGGLNKVCGVSPELQAIVGEPALPRTEIVKQLWQYIRKNNLQDPSNKRKIICDDALRVVFETDCTDMFKMNKLLAKHIIPLQPSKESSQAKRAKVDVETPTENTEPGASLVGISERLAEFLGTTEREMTQTEASRRVWEYIKLKQLEDPLNSMAIQCDTKLRDLLGCESISAVGVGEVLARHHLFKRS
ncbi:hypothetical protein POPTR_006G010700v4 [Populus trichocarpa]|uniref:Uncharacterized protein n=2 Tax=Populus trichocarpa TaxID=3694 RepID=A0ACC0SRQ7_POPTR|nr:uncharacterized protein LOC7458496 isoform X1 [Populus trichocarpa]XP_024458205.2 uncharacterized protein LOC7458496 isoform X1 [Populus trichocarpa]ABK94708.1 unknown [Populus trichocarpa]KAI9391917.1 hypothetical protein POPTR_006G010700v4 [Populus trichocarpa]